MAIARHAASNQGKRVAVFSLEMTGQELMDQTISQLSRSVEQRNPPIPVLSDLRESGSIEQDADIVLMLYRQSMYDEDCAEPNTTDVYVRKNRHGPTGRVSLYFDRQTMSFRDLARREELLTK